MAVALAWLPIGQDQSPIAAIVCRLEQAKAIRQANKNVCKGVWSNT